MGERRRKYEEEKKDRERKEDVRRVVADIVRQVAQKSRFPDEEVQTDDLPGIPPLEELLEVFRKEEAIRKEIARKEREERKKKEAEEKRIKEEARKKKEEE